MSDLENNTGQQVQEIPADFRQASAKAAAEYKEQCKVDRDGGQLADCDFKEGAEWAYKKLIEQKKADVREVIKAAGDFAGAIHERDKKLSPHIAVIFGEWQRCPCCDGNGQIWVPPIIGSYPSNGVLLPQTCNTCGGTKLIQRPVLAAPPSNP